MKPTLKGIKSAKELEFTVFCIESVAAHLDADSQRVYAALAVESDILSSYIVPSYEVLHTQSKEYIVRDILQVMAERGVQV